MISEHTTFPDDVSSISGSESDSEEEGDCSDSVPSSAAKLGSYESNEFMQVKGYKDDVIGSFPGYKQDDSGAEKRHEHLRLMAARHVKIFFENEDGKILSIYRCLLHGKKASEFWILILIYGVLIFEICPKGETYERNNCVSIYVS
jgi:hypothetical protein